MSTTDILITLTTAAVALPDIRTAKVQIQARINNSAIAYVGTSISQSRELEPGDSVEFVPSGNQLKDIYVRGFPGNQLAILSVH